MEVNCLQKITSPEGFLTFETKLSPSKSPYDSSASIDQDTSLFLHGRNLGKISLNYNIRTKKAYVKELRIAERYRNNGLGTKLLQEVSKDLEALGCKEVELFALTDQETQKDLPKLTRFYQKCGFQPDPKNTFFTAGLTMRKTLTKRKHYEKN